MLVKQMMTKRPATVKPGDTFRKAVHSMASKNISGCPVVKQGKLVGIVTQTDIIRAVDVYGKINKSDDVFSLLVSMLKSKQDNSHLRKMLNLKVAKIMNRDVVSVGIDHDIYEAARLMNKHDIDRLPVVQQNQLVGILTKSDVMKFLQKVK